MLATGHNRGEACLWEVATGKLCAKLIGHQLEVLGVAFSPDGKTLATGSIDDIIRLWDAETGQPKGKPINHRGQVFALTWMPTARRSSPATRMVRPNSGMPRPDSGKGRRFPTVARSVPWKSVPRPG